MGCLGIIISILLLPIVFAFPIGIPIFIIVFIYMVILPIIKSISKMIDNKKRKKMKKELNEKVVLFKQQEEQQQKLEIAMFKNVESTLELIDNMNGYEFEDYLVNKLLPKLGYEKIEGTQYSGDYGVDIVAYKDNIKCAIQCKRFRDKVSNSAIQEVVAGRKHYKCNKAMVITNNYFTENAKELAFDNQVELWDRDRLIKILKKIDTT